MGEYNKPTTPQQRSQPNRTCPKCLKSFRNRVDYETHVSRCVHGIIKTLCCTLCKQRYSYRTTLSAHVKKCIQSASFVQKYSGSLNETLCYEYKFDAIYRLGRMMEYQLYKFFEASTEQAKLPRFFNAYVLIDARMINEHDDVLEQWRAFVSSIFYVGKGENGAVCDDLVEAFATRNNSNRSNAIDPGGSSLLSTHGTVDDNVTCTTQKNDRIWKIWRSGRGVAHLQLYNKFTEDEVNNMQASIIHTLRLANLTNDTSGIFHGPTQNWSDLEIEHYGNYLLHKMFQLLDINGMSETKHEEMQSRMFCASVS